MRIVDAMNTYNPALHVIASLGYALEIDPSDEEDSIGFWTAKKNDFVAEADNPLAIPGLVSIFEAKGEHWHCREEVDLYDKIISDAYED